MNLPNNLTILRILLVPLFIASLLYYSEGNEMLRLVAIFIFIAACVTDAADGFAARRLGQQTRLGSYIDPIADKLLLLGGFLSLSFMSHLPVSMKIPAWVTIAVVSRDSLIIIGSMLVFITTGSLTPRPLFTGKATTAAQMLTLLGSLTMAPASVREILFILTFGLTIFSGLLYLRMGNRLLQGQNG